MLLEAHAVAVVVAHPYQVVVPLLLPEEVRITIQIWSDSRRRWYLGRRSQIFKPWRRRSSSRGRRVFAKSAAAQIILKPR
jgi:hypothetical protein